MSKERLGKRERVRVSDWVARAIGVTCTTTMLMFPAGIQTSLNSEAAPFNPGVAYEPPPPPVIEQPPPPPVQQGMLTRDTGIDMDACRKFTVCGTDLGLAFLLPKDASGNQSVGYLLGDTFAVAGPHLKDLPPGADMWRSPVMMRSNVLPEPGQPIVFDSAAGLAGEGIAPEFMQNAHRDGHEITVLPNDAVSLPNGDIVVSFMSIGAWTDGKAAGWQTNYAGLAISHDGNWFERIPEALNSAVWENGYFNTDTGITEPCNEVAAHCNTDPFQMWSMQLNDDGYVYIVSVRAGRQQGPMMMLRVPWDHMTDKGSYACWNGSDWGGKCMPIIDHEVPFGEPSLRKLRDGTWVMSYTAYGNLYTRTAQNPEGPWSDAKEQLTQQQLPALYDGSIHPYSTADNLILMVSTWQTEGDAENVEDRQLLRYDISHLNTTA